MLMLCPVQRPNDSGVEAAVAFAVAEMKDAANDLPSTRWVGAAVSVPLDQDQIKRAGGLVALDEGPSSPPDPPKRHGGVASGQCRRSCARSVREPSISRSCGGDRQRAVCWYDATLAVAPRHCVAVTLAAGVTSQMVAAEC